VDEIVEELQQIARDGLEFDITDPDALSELGVRARAAAGALESFAMDLEGAEER
jgi:hypothetical protein